MQNKRKWGEADTSPSLLAALPMTQAQRVTAVARQYEQEVRQARERLAAAKDLLAQARRLRHPMLPQCDCGRTEPPEPDKD